MWLGGIGCQDSLWSLKVVGIEIEAVLLWAYINKSLAARRSSTTLQSHRPTDVHFEIARAKEADLRPLLLLGSLHLFDRPDDHTCGIRAEKKVEERDDQSGREE